MEKHGAGEQTTEPNEQRLRMQVKAHFRDVSRVCNCIETFETAIYVAAFDE